MKSFSLRNLDLKKLAAWILVVALTLTSSNLFADGIIGVRFDEMPRKNGIYIQVVVAGSPADQSGLRTESIVTHVDGQRVNDFPTLKRAISSHSPGDTVRLTVIDDNETTEFSVLVAATSTRFTERPVSDELNEALAEVRDIGGSTREDIRRPGSPVIGVSIDAHRASDRSLIFLAGFTELKKLTIENCDESARLTGVGLVDLSGLSKLRELVLPKCNFDAAFAKRVCKLPQIRSLDLRKATVSREAFQELVTRHKLTELNLDGLKISDDDLNVLGQMTSLRKLNLNNTQVKGSGLVHLKVLTQLTHLYLVATETKDAELVHLAEMDKLVELGLSETGVTDKGLVHLKKMEHLESLGLSHAGTRATDQEPSPLAGTNVGSVTAAAIVSTYDAIADGQSRRRITPGITAAGLETHLKHLANLRELWIEGPEFEPSDVRRLGRLWRKAKIVTSRKLILPTEE